MLWGCRIGIYDNSVGLGLGQYKTLGAVISLQWPFGDLVVDNNFAINGCQGGVIEIEIPIDLGICRDYGVYLRRL